MGGVYSTFLEIEGGVKILELHGSLRLGLLYRDSPENPEFGAKVKELEILEGLNFLVTCSAHFVRRRLGRILWNSAEKRPNRRQKTCTEHASKKIRLSKRGDFSGKPSHL